MARKPRIDLPGFHHIFNRGVGRSKVYKSDEDKDEFLSILCRASSVYQVTVHDYCLMDNYYHLIVETVRENLSLFMRKLSADYAIYFNKRYKRAGHLWRGRYNSWYIDKENDAYLSIIFRYIEHSPFKGRASGSIGEYPYTLIGTLRDKGNNYISCAESSRLKIAYIDKNMQELLQNPLSKKELRQLKELQKKPIAKNGDAKQIKTLSLQNHFRDCNTLAERNEAILLALKDGYTQGEVARHIGISAAMVSKIFRSSK